MRCRGVRALWVLSLGAFAACGGERGVPERRDLTLSALDSLLAEGEAAYSGGDFERAGLTFASALEGARSAGADTAADPAVEPVALTWLALIHWKRGALDEAWETGIQALDLTEERGLDEHLFMARNALGLIAWYQGRLEEATLRFEQALEAARAVGDLENQAKVPLNLALVHQERGDLAGARAGFTAALEAARELGERRLEAIALNNLGALHIWLDEDPAAAVERLGEARHLFREIGDPTSEINSIGQLGTAYAAMGRPELAWTRFDTALTLARAAGLRQEEASNLELLGDLQSELGDGRSALRFYDEAGSAYRDMGMLLEHGNILRKSAAVLAEAGDVETARARASEATRLHRDIGASYEQLHDLLLRAGLAARDGARGESELHLDTAAALADAMDVRVARAAVVMARARVMEALSEPGAVLSSLRTGAEVLASTTLQDGWELHGLRARAFAATGEVDSAVVAGREAVAGLERVRGAIADGMGRASFVAARSDVYAEVAVALLRAGRAAEAWEVADAARGRALLDHLGAVRRSVDAGSAVGDFADAQRLLREIDELVRLLDEERSVPPDERGEGGAALEQDLEQRLAEVRGRYETRIRGDAWRRFEASAAGLRPTPLAAVQAALRQDEALVEYLVTEDAVVAFVVTREELRTVTSEVRRDALASRVRLALSLMERPDTDPGAFDPVLEGLYDLLVTPVERLAPAGDRSRWILVPHGVLAYLPFAALRDAATGRRLVEDRVISLLPNAGALPYQRDVASASPDDGSLPSVRAFAPVPDELPATRREVRELREVRSQGPGVTAAVGRRASESAVREALEEGHVVHVASHGTLNARNPLFSAITLATPRRWTSSRDDGRLEVHEVLGLRIRSPLVFLSGCETGRGSAWSTSFDAGEDYATLAQAFLYAGARSVVATLWKIRDDGAATFATRFYGHVQQAEAAEALARTQRDVLRDERWSHPYYWAPYVVNGGG